MAEETPYINDGISYYQPIMREIIVIIPFPGDANSTLIQTSVAHNYIAGEIVRIIIPEEYGMQQLNNFVGSIGLIPGFPDFFAIKVDITSFDEFNMPVAPKQIAQSIPIGEINSKLTGATKNILRTGTR